MSAYNQLIDLKKSGQLDLFVVIAPPRTGSTMLQSVISRSQSIDVGINDPQGQEEGYQQILDETHRLLRQKSKATILVKEMSHWIHLNEEYKKVFALASKVVLSIRNPLLSTESRIKKFIESLTIKPIPKVHAWLLDNVGRDSSLVDVNIANQMRLLDMYAESHGFANWELMVSSTYESQNYTGFEGLLSADNSPTGFAVEQLGWAAIHDEVRYLQDVGQALVLVDSTDFRLMPEKVARAFCQQLNIDFDRTMIQGWEKEAFRHLITENTPEDKLVQSLWYDSISKSEGVNPPNERMPALGSFPLNIQEYLRATALPIYVELYTSEHRVKVEDETRHEGMKEIDPVFSVLSENPHFTSQLLLNFLIQIAETREGDFKGRRK